MKQSYSTKKVPLSERLDSWREQSGTVLFPMEFDTDEYIGQKFFGAMVSQQVGSITIHEIKAQAHNVHHTKPTRFSGEVPYIVVILQAFGEGYIAQGGHDVVLQPDDFVLIDTTKAFELKFPGPMKEFLIQIPWDTVRQDLLSPERITGLAIKGDKGIGRIVSNFLSSFIQEAPSLNATEVSSLTRSIIESLYIAALSYLDDSARESSGCQALQLHQIRLYLEEHLRDAHLTIDKIAEAHGISQRYLHKLFEAEGASIGRLIWERRLVRCRRDLENPFFSGKSITEIAYSWGFNSSSHFSRIFKERFNKSPREIRKAAISLAKSKDST
jgi:AraC family transcriptional regulator, positive regulator of tynA and feaB